MPHLPRERAPASDPAESPGRLEPGVSLDGRRKILKLSLVGSLVLGTLGLGGLALQKTKPVTPLGPLTFFSPREFSILVSAAEAILPNGTGAAARRVAQGVDGFLGSCDPVYVSDVKKLLLVLENGASSLLLGGRLAPFSQLPLAHRRELLEVWQKHRISLFRTGYLAIKRLVLTVHYADESTWAGLGYAGPPDFGAFDPAAEPIFVAAGVTGGRRGTER